MSYRFAAYSYPHLAVDPHVAIVDQLPVADWSFEDQRERYRSSINVGIPSHRQLLLNSIFFVNPDDHNDDIGSIIHVYREDVVDASDDPRPVVSFLLDRRPDRAENQSTELTELSGVHVLGFFEYARVRAWDYPITPSVEIDWMYGADSILGNGDFDSGSVGNEIQSIWIDEDVNGGTFDVGFKGDTATGLAWNINQSTLQTSLQSAFTTVISLSVAGAGEEDNPFLIEFQDPGGMDEPQMTVVDNLTNGTLHVDTVQNGGQPSYDPWTPSILLTTGQLHGRHSSDSPRLDDFVSRSGDYSIRVNGLEQFAGIQQIVQVVPGMRYRASIWLYVENTTDLFRLVIRDRFEALIAHSTPFEDVGTLNDWKEFTCEFIAPSWTNLIVFRFAYVGTGNPAPFWLDDASLAPGAPASTIGAIWLELLADIQTDHAADWRESFLEFVVPTFDAALDSAGAAWPGVHTLTINEGNTYLQLMEHHTNQYGYEFDLWYSTDDDEWYFDIFNPGAMGTSYPVEFPALVVGGGVTGGEAVRSAPMGTSVFVRGSGGRWFEGIRSDARFAWGRREHFVSAPDAHSYFDLTAIHNRELERLESDMLGLQYKVADNAQSVPMLHYRAGDYITVTPGSDTAISSGTRRIESVKVNGRGGVVTDIDVHVQNEVFGSLGLAAQAEAVRRLLRKMVFREPETGAPAFVGLGGGGIPDVVIGAADTVYLDTANLVCDGINDEDEFNQAMAMLDGQDKGWIHLLAGSYYVSLDWLIDGINNLKITGAGVGNTTIFIEDSTALVYAVMWFGGTTEGPNNLLSLTLQDFTIDGNTGGGTSVGRGLISGSFGSQVNVYMQNVELMNSPNHGLGADSPIGRTANFWHITDCHFHDNDGSGAALHESSSQIKGTRIRNNGSHGIHALYGCLHTLDGCTITGNGGDGIAGAALDGLAVWIVGECFIDSNTGGGVIGSALAGPSIIVGNIITNNGGAAINVAAGSITGPNVISGNGDDVPNPPFTTGVDPDDIPQTSGQVVTFSYEGTLIVGTGTMRFVAPRTGTIVGIRASVGTAPTGAAILVDVNKNSGTIYTTQANRPTIAVSTNQGAETVPDVTSLVDGDYLTVDIDQIGSTVAGEHLSVHIDVAWELTPGA